MSSERQQTQPRQGLSIDDFFAEREKVYEKEKEKEVRKRNIKKFLDNGRTSKRLSYPYYLMQNFYRLVEDPRLDCNDCYRKLVNRLDSFGIKRLVKYDGPSPLPEDIFEITPFTFRLSSKSTYHYSLYEWKSDRSSVKGAYCEVPLSALVSDKDILNNSFWYQHNIKNLLDRFHNYNLNYCIDASNPGNALRAEIREIEDQKYAIDEARSEYECLMEGRQEMGYPEDLLQSYQELDDCPRDLPMKAYHNAEARCEERYKRAPPSYYLTILEYNRETTDCLRRIEEKEERYQSLISKVPYFNCLNNLYLKTSIVEVFKEWKIRWEKIFHWRKGLPRKMFKLWERYTHEQYIKKLLRQNIKKIYNKKLIQNSFRIWNSWRVKRARSKALQPRYSL